MALAPRGYEAPMYYAALRMYFPANPPELNCGVVREGDEIWDWMLGSDGYMHHRPRRGNSGAISHFWAVARLGVTGQVIRVMDVEEIVARKERYSKQWKTTPLAEIPWYGIKTVIREVCSYLPKNARFAAALRYDEAEQEPAPEDDPPTPTQSAGDDEPVPV